MRSAPAALSWTDTFDAIGSAVLVLANTVGRRQRSREHDGRDEPFVYEIHVHFPYPLEIKEKNGFP
jgi:hypothetical protein